MLFDVYVYIYIWKSCLWNYIIKVSSIYFHIFLSRYILFFSCSTSERDLPIGPHLPFFRKKKKNAKDAFAAIQLLNANARCYGAEASGVVVFKTNKAEALGTVGGKWCTDDHSYLVGGRWWFQRYFFNMFTPKFGEDVPIRRSYFSDGLKPPTIVYYY